MKRIPTDLVSQYMTFLLREKIKQVFLADYKGIIMKSRCREGHEGFPAIILGSIDQPLFINVVNENSRMPNKRDIFWTFWAILENSNWNEADTLKLKTGTDYSLGLFMIYSEVMNLTIPNFCKHLFEA